MKILAADEAEITNDQTIIDRELAAIRGQRGERLGADAERIPWSGIGLSGGGIRSATFCLGVLQALAENDLLKRFDYLSSVSGGGYIASSLQWWWGAPRDVAPPADAPVFGLGPADFPYGPARPDTVGGPQAGERNLAFLRAHSSYLTPGHGIGIWSILGVLLRTIIISTVTWLPLFAALFVVLTLISFQLDQLFERLDVLSPLFGFMDVRWRDSCELGVRFKCDLAFSSIYALALWLFYIVTATFAVAAILFALLSRAPQDGRDPVLTFIVFSVAALASAAACLLIIVSDAPLALSQVLVAVGLAITFVVCVIIVLSEVLTPRSLNASYLLRRTTEKIMGLAFVPSLATLVFATIPIIPILSYEYIVQHSAKATLVALAGLLSGVGTALYGYYTFLRSIVPGLVGRIAATVASIIALYMLAVIAYLLAMIFLHSNDFAMVFLLPSNDFDWGVDIRFGIGGAMLLAFVIAVYANVNFVGFHRFYRDRLMEAFMPSDRAVADMQSGFSAIGDSLSIENLRRYFEPRPANATWRYHPYPLVNANLILVNDDDQKVASRGGDNFLISPLYMGSASTGWLDTATYIERSGPFTLASAMAASGAAANASAGYIGTGITMNPLVSLVMSLLNVRLGLWVSNPGRQSWSPVRSIPTFLMMMLYTGFSRHRRDSKFLELTDGGHFENLGLYELVRRKLEVILIVDGEEDPTISLSSLVSAARRIEQDFGARLDFPLGEGGPERLVMYPATGGYPVGVKYAKAPFLVGTIAYGDGKQGVLVYVKATVIREMDFTTAGYLANNPAFPHQTTADQFFDPDQFDAYRLLGYESARKMIETLRLQETMAGWKAIADRYNSLLPPAPTGD